MTNRTPDQLGKETGEALGLAIANGLEPILMRIADAVAQLQAEQAELRDGLLVLEGAVKALASQHGKHLREQHGG